VIEFLVGRKRLACNNENDEDDVLSISILPKNGNNQLNLGITKKPTKGWCREGRKRPRSLEDRKAGIFAA
jgi:hypothetical protein